MSEWHAVRITVPPAAAEAIEFGLNELDALGTEIDQLRKDPGDDLTVVGYFTDLPEADLINRVILNALSIYGADSSLIRSLTTDVVQNADWLAEWKKYWRPTKVGRFVIAPSWENVAVGEDTIVIRIEPNMAFGTGTHETTKLCLRALDGMYRPEMSFLDVGTGTGILAITAAKIQASETANSAYAPILGIELDHDSITIARENAATNGVADRIEFREGTLVDTVPAFDFVCANLTIDIILPILPLLLDRFGETLVLSGILVEQEEIITRELKTLGAGRHTIEHDGEWISVTISR